MIDAQSNEQSDGLLEVKASEKLTKADLDHLEPVIEKYVAETIRPRLLLVMEEFDGWEDVGAFFKDLHMDSKYIGKFDRIAISGDAEWEALLTKMVNPLTSSEIKFFDLAKITQARKWLNHN